MGISQILYILLIGFVAYNMIKRGGCYGSQHQSHRPRSSRGGCCGGHSHHQESHNYSNDMEVDENKRETQKRIGY